MKQIVYIAKETFTILRRDRVFLPAVFVGISLLALTGIASYWGIEEFRKILYDLGAMFFQLTGYSIAIFWGTKILNDSKQEGSIEWQLSAPVARINWLLGRFLGLSFALFLIASFMLFTWQMIYMAYGMGVIQLKTILIFSFLTLSWLLMASVATLFASVTSSAIALFSSFWLMLLGLISQPVMQALSPETPESMKAIVRSVAGVWNLHAFNTSGLAASSEYLSQNQMLDLLAYGLLLIGLVLSLACIVFQKRDLSA